MLTVLRLHREMRGLTQAELGQLAGLRQEYLSRIEHRWVVPTPQQRQRLAEALGTPEDVLFESSGLARVWEGPADVR
jgi:transcriptional regulator with XRE-family HTH domain